MKKFLLAFITCILCLSLGVLGASADSAIEIDAQSYTKIASGVTLNKSSICIRKGTWALYEVEFSSIPTTVELSVASDRSSAGLVELRFGSEKGEVLASMNIKDFLTQDTWGRTICNANINKKLKGTQIIAVSGGGVAFDFYSMTFYGAEDSVQKKMLSQPVEDEFTDIADEPGRNKINALGQLGIAGETGGIYNPRLPMTRLMFASMLGRAINAELYAQDTLPFTDIAADAPEAKTLAGLYNLGIINGTADGKFNPLGFIKPNEAAIICTRALGYTFMDFSDADLMNLAVRLKLFRDVDSKALALTKADGAAIIYNMLLSDYMFPHGIEGSNILYEPQKDAIDMYSNIKYGEGIVTENYYTSLYKGKTADARICIDGEEYLPGETDAASYLGTLCNYFYTETNGNRLLKAIVQSDDVDITLFESAPQQKLKTLSENSIEFYDGDKLCKFKLNSQTAIIYNGVALDTPLSSLVDASEFVGKITMIDNDGNRVQDCVWIDSAENMVVGGVSGSLVYDLLSGTAIDTDDGCFELYLEGKSQIVKSLKTGTVLTVYRSVNKSGDKLVRATSALTQISGMVCKLYDVFAVIGEQDYKISGDLDDMLYVGDTGIFYTNDFGHIVRFEKNDDTLKVGCFFGVDHGQNGLSVAPSVKLLTEDKGIVILNTAERVVADGITIKSPTDLYKGAGEFAGLGNIRLNTPVLYKLDNNGRLCLIDTVEQGSQERNDGLTRLGASESFKHYGGLLLTTPDLSCKYPVPAKAKVIRLSSDGREENHRIVTGLSTGDKTFSAIPYTSDSDSMIADIVVWENCDTGVGKWGTPFVVTKMAMIYDEVQEAAVPCLYGCAATNNVTYIIDEQSYRTDAGFKKLIDSLVIGDVVWPATTGDRLSNAEIILLSSGEQSNSAGVEAVLCPGEKYIKDGGTSKGKVVFGQVVRVEDGYARVQYDSPDSFETFNVSGAQVASVDKEDDGRVTAVNKMNSTSIFEGQFIVGIVNKITYQMTSAIVLHDIVSE